MTVRTNVTSPGLSLRDRKAVMTRLRISRALSARLTGSALADISADDLAKDAEISRMTFFNHFPSKEHAVDYLMMVWLVELEEALVGKRGVAAILGAFARMGEEMAREPERMRRIFGYFAARDATRPMPLPTAAEAHLIAPKLPPGHLVQGLGGFFLRTLAEARADGELALPGSDYELAHFLGSIANGTVHVGQSSPETDWRQLFRRHAHRALGLFERPEIPAPRAPRVPARYRAHATAAPAPTTKPTRDGRSR